MTQTRTLGLKPAAAISLLLVVLSTLVWWANRPEPITRPVVACTDSDRLYDVTCR